MSETEGMTNDIAEAPVVPDDPFVDLPDQAVFDRGYVDSLRREGQKYRTEAQQAAQSAQRYNDVFGVYEQQDQDAWLDLMNTWAQDPEVAARRMQRIATGVLGDGTAMTNSMDGEPQEPVETAEDQLTPAKVKEMIEAGFQTREQQASEQRAVDNVMAEVRAQGFDPDTAEGFMVLWRANHETGGDIKAAAESVRGYRQQVIDEYVQGRSSGRVAIPTGNGVQATANDQPITNLEDARRAADNFIRGQRGA